MSRAGFSLIRPLVPARARRWFRLKFGWQWFQGDYPDWTAARAAAAGYDDASVLVRVLAATREVRSGRARWERDGVAFTEPAVHAPVLTALRAAAEREAGPLVVVDFGGSLGSTWWQHRSALADLPGVQWRVVEQPHFVRAGAEFTDGSLSFHDSIDAAVRSGDRPVILLSSVLPYVESPLTLLDGIARRGFRTVIIDRTPLVRSGPTRLVVQQTPPGLGGGSYPCWLLARAQLLARLGPDYKLVAEWPAVDDLALDVVHRGFSFFRKEA
jgi:putative methyltransferase (TIGR04325 family)